MAYSDFTLRRVELQFGLTTNIDEDFFAGVAPVMVSDRLRDHLALRTPLALAIGTEKARSELLIMPILLEAVDQFGKGCSLAQRNQAIRYRASSIPSIARAILTVTPATHPVTGSADRSTTWPTK